MSDDELESGHYFFVTSEIAKQIQWSRNADATSFGDSPAEFYRPDPGDDKSAPVMDEAEFFRLWGE